MYQLSIAGRMSRFTGELGMAERRIVWTVIAVLALASGCRATRQVRDPEYAAVVNTAIQPTSRLESVARAVDPVAVDLDGPRPLEQYIQIALSHNPEIQASRKRMEAIAHQVPVAASLPDPMLNTTAFPEPVQTAAGQQELILAVNQKFPWRRKLSLHAGVAESQTDVARAQLASVELATIERVKKAYYELYFIQQATSVTEAQRNLLVQIRDAANARYRAALTSQQDVLRAELELSQIEDNLIRLRQQLVSAQAKLARLLHVAPQTKVRALDYLSRENVPLDLEWLERQAVAARPELHAQLAALQRDRQGAQLARLDYVPDLTLGMSWIDVADAGISPVSNGRDAFLVTAGVNLPIYRKRLNSNVRSAEAKAVATAREYDALRDTTLEQVLDLFAQAQSQQDLLKLFEEDILPKARQTLEVSDRAYGVGEVDFLTLLDNFGQLLRYEVNYRRLEASLGQTLAELERVVGGYAYLAEPSEVIPRPDEQMPPPAAPMLLPPPQEE
jgi:outer membrane protein TolC